MLTELYHALLKLKFPIGSFHHWKLPQQKNIDLIAPSESQTLAEVKQITSIKKSLKNKWKKINLTKETILSIQDELHS